MPDSVKGAITAILASDGLKARRRSLKVRLPMRYDLTQQVLDLHGKTLNSEQAVGPNGAPMDDPKSPPLTLGIVFFRAALFVEANTNPPAEEKFKQAQLAEKITKAGSTVDLNTEEMGRLRAAVGRMYLPTIIYRVWNMIDAHSGGSTQVN